MGGALFEISKLTAAQGFRALPAHDLAPGGLLVGDLRQPGGDDLAAGAMTSALRARSKKPPGGRGRKGLGLKGGPQATSLA